MHCSLLRPRQLLFEHRVRSAVLVRNYGLGEYPSDGDLVVDWTPCYATPTCLPYTMASGTTTTSASRVYWRLESNALW